MPQKHPFYLYEVGEPSELLSLGTLVLQNYKNPLLVRHVSHRMLSENEKAAYVSSSPIKNACFSNKRGWTPGVSLEAAELITIDLSNTSSGEKRVTAKSGERVQLKEPKDFLFEIALKEEKALDALKLWLSAARSDYMLKLRWIRKPKIWMLTGQYLLDNARSMSIVKGKTTGKLGISSVAIAALTTVPIGGSVGLGHDCNMLAKMEVPGRQVWAARYHLLDTDFVKMAVGAKPSLPPSITLYSDITSSGSLRGTDDEQNVQLAMAPDLDHASRSGSDVPQEREESRQSLIDAYEDTDQYEIDLEAGIQQFERVLDKAMKADATQEPESDSKGDDDDTDENEDGNTD